MEGQEAAAPLSRGKERELAIASLIDAYQEKYKDQPDAFFVHPSIAFVATDNNGIAVVATGDIAKHADNIEEPTSLLVLPHQERVSLSNVQSAELKSLLKEINKTYQSKADCVVEGDYVLKDVCIYGHVALAVVVMHAYGISRNSEQEDTLLSKVAQTWPSYEEMRQGCSIWDYRPEVSKLLRGTITAEHLQLNQKSDRLVWEEIILPTLLSVSPSTMDMLLPKLSNQSSDVEEEESSKIQRLSGAYLHASYLVRSRAHKGRQQDQPEIIPLVDLLNGLPKGCCDDNDSSVKGGGAKVNAFQAGKHTNRIAALRDIVAGEELVHSYGIHTADSFIRFYGCCPQEIIDNPNVPHLVDNVLLRLPSYLAPPDELRTWACRELNLPSTQEEIQDSYICYLLQETLGPFSQDMQINTLFLLGTLGPSLPGAGKDFGGGPQLETLCQYLKLCHLIKDDEDVREIVKTRKLVARFNFMHLSHLLQLVVDHVLENVTDLGSTTNESDLQLANDPSLANDLVIAYRARIAQRNALAQWRHAFCCRHGVPSQHAEPPAVFDNLMTTRVERHNILLTNFPAPQAPQCLMTSGGCRYCGRTLYLKSCSKCQKTRYCSREHQKLDWKWHKQLCGLA